MLLGICLAASISPAREWTKTQVDSCDCPYSVSIAVRSDGNPCIVYGWRKLVSPNLYTEELRYAERQSGNWRVEVIDSCQGLPWHDYPVLRLDTLDRPHAVVLRGDTPYFYICYATRSDSAWSVQVIDSEPYSPAWARASLAVTQAGIPHMVYTYLASGVNELRYATLSGDSWQKETVWHSASQEIGLSTIALTPVGEPRIALYSEGPTGDEMDTVLYVWPAPGGWQFFCIDNFLEGNGTSLAVDSLKMGHVLYDSEAELRYAVTDGYSCHNEPVDFCGYYALYDLKLDSHQSPCLALFESDYPDQPAFMWRDTSGVWQKEYVEDVGYQPIPSISLALSRNDQPFLAYYLGYPAQQPYGFHVAEGAVGLTESGPPVPAVVSRLATLPSVSRDRFRFDWSSGSAAQLDIFSSLGKRVFSAGFSAGGHTFTWDARDRLGRTLSPGAYFVRVTSRRGSATGKVVLDN
jgi:hypothetical protein